MMRIVTCGIIHLARKIFWKTNISYPWYAFVHVRIMRQESITFSENFAYVLMNDPYLVLRFLLDSEPSESFSTLKILEKLFFLFSFILQKYNTELKNH